jgi:hypothetical protein
MHSSHYLHPEPGAVMRSSVRECFERFSVTVEIDRTDVTVFLEFGDLDRFAEVLRSTAEQVEQIAEARHRQRVEEALLGLRADADRMMAQ